MLIDHIITLYLLLSFVRRGDFVTKGRILLKFYFYDVQEQLKFHIHTNFRSEWFHGCVIDYGWISKLLRDVAFTWRGTCLSEHFMYYKFTLWNKTEWQMFLLVSGRHVGAHPDGHQHGVSTQISINLDNKFLCISCIRKILALTWIIARVFAFLPSFLFLHSALYLLNGFDFCFDLFWMARHWKPAIP